MDVQQGDGGEASIKNMFDTLARDSDTPLEVGELAVSDSGTIYPRPDDQPIRFDFIYEGVAFDAEMAADLNGPLTLTAGLGVLPYSAETTRGRKAVVTLLRHAALTRGAIALDERGHVRLTLNATPPRPRTPVTVVATAASLLVEARPYIALLRAAGALRGR